MTLSPEPLAAPSRVRWDVIDVARGVAILAMIVYHFGWDLSFLKLIETNLITLPAWRWFARGIAGSFLFLSGIGLVLAHGRGIRWRPFLRRLAIVGGAALLVTVATYFVFPDSFIFFGILHCIALSSILALPFLRAPRWIAVAVAAFVLAGPWLFTGAGWDRPVLDWLGLGAFDPVTNDYVPIFPWFALVLLGTVWARTFMLVHQAPQPAPWQASGATGRGLIWAGRHSLPIYLLHQIVLLGFLFGVLQLTGPNAAVEAKPFVLECESTCLRQNAEPATCRSVCGCVVTGLRRDGLWARVLANDVDDEARMRVSRLTQQCLREAPKAAP
ncbi:DUF1624 domain-containing protein [Microvirga antarctica]|uniref:DUF1624 domain-containing protein n=1 Tax=Microvirga antarctica TaxID=2819233 RepID=UPI001B3093A4|nr:heparan-alpha-glucosaminide N-acetyltransferase [Microvirga antarctica]